MIVIRGLLIVCLTANFVSAAERLATSRTPRRMPPEGIPIPAEVEAELQQGVAQLGARVKDLNSALKSRPTLLELLPDVEIYLNAVRYALEDHIFYKTNDFHAAQKFLAEGMERAGLLRDGQMPWTTANGLIVRGYRSRLDQSVQPYGLVVPPSFQPGGSKSYRLDFWFHGRNEKLSELSFISDRESNRGEFTPPDTFVLHPYGRYCNAYKFAGEVDAFEALESVRSRYSIDPNRISVRGFSMGGAATWHLAAHHAGLWAAAAPGAGFVDTSIFQKVSEWKTQPPWYVQTLWHLYDSKDYAGNLFNCPVVAYSGEIDGQRQAAELMSQAMAAEGLKLVHIIGPNTAHKYEPKAKEEVARRVDALAERGRDPVPTKVRFTTWTLRYNQMAWVTIDALEHHWSRARVEAEIAGPAEIKASTTNVSALSFSLASGLSPWEGGRAPQVMLDGQTIEAPAPSSDRSWTAHFEKQGSHWKRTTGPAVARHGGELRKRHGLQGPIDDAFMDAFMMVRPTGKPLNAESARWTGNAMAKAITEWRLQFRGEPRVVDDVAVSASDIASNNLVLWGDPRSNRLLNRLTAKLPLRWNASGIRLAGKTYSSLDHVPMLIYPNPLNPSRYIVLNSGFTFSDAAPTSNALQIPELPDYAVLDLNTGVPTTAGFFDERWQLPSK
jgi:pimeloyl-ACP methyl ester carboxylesterase